MNKLLLLLFPLMVIGSCTKNEVENVCADVDCQNGVCIDGVCYCENGYYGINCDSIFPVEPIPFDRCDTLQCLNGGTCIDGRCHCPYPYDGYQCQINYNEIIECYMNYPYDPADCPFGYIGNNCSALIEDVIVGAYPERLSMLGLIFTYNATAEIFKGAQSNEFYLVATPFSTDSILMQRNVLTLTIPQQPYNGNTVSGQGSLNITNMSIYITLELVYGGSVYEENFRKDASI